MGTIKVVASKLTASMLEQGEVLVVSRNGEPLCWVRKSEGWWKYDCQKVGTTHWQPCESVAEVKQWISLNRGVY